MRTVFTIHYRVGVLGLPKTGLIFTGLQEGAQPGGGGDPTWPNRAQYSIPCDVTLGSGGGERRGGDSLVAWGGAVPVLFGRAAV